MVNSPKISKAALLKLIDDLESRPHDRIRIIAELGITIISMSGAPAASVATIIGFKSVFGLSAAAKIFGWMPSLLITNPPGILVLSCATVFGLLAFFFARLIRGGGMAEGRKAELLEKFKEQAKSIAAKEKAASITDVDRTQFILSLREIIDADAIPIASAFRMIEMVEAGRMPISQAVSLTKACLETRHPRQFLKRAAS